MKLHLPKLLFATIVAAASYIPHAKASDSNATVQAEREPLYYNVGAATQIDKANSYTLPSEMLNSEGCFEVKDGDKVGLFNGTPGADTFVTEFYSGVASTNEHLTTISSSLTINGDLKISGSGQVYLGGKSGSHFYSGLKANNVTITTGATGKSADSDPQIAPDLNLRADYAELKTLTVNGGAVHLRTFLDSGDTTSGPAHDSHKSVKISNGLYVNDGYVLIGRQGNGTTQTDGHRSEVDKHFMSIIGGEIKQTNGTLILQGKTYLDTNTIVQTGGIMKLAYDNTAGYDILRLGKETTTIETDSTDANTDLHIEGKIGYYDRSFVDALMGKPSKPANAVLNINQKGLGTISLDNGVEFTSKNASKITQSGAGTINLNGNYTSAKFNIEQTGNGTINFKSAAKMNIGTVTQNAGSIYTDETASVNIDTLNAGVITQNAAGDGKVNASIQASNVKLSDGEMNTVNTTTTNSGKLTVDTVNVNSGSLVMADITYTDANEKSYTKVGSMKANTVNVNAGSLSVDGTGSVTAGTVNAAGVTMTGEVLLSKGAISTEGDTVTNTGTLNAGQIVVNSGVFVNKGVIDALETQQDAALMLLAGETEEYGLVINGGKVENFGTYEKSILVNGGTLTLEDKSKVASVTVDSGTVLVTGDSTLDSLTLNGDSTLNITYGASITLTDQDAFSLSENATIMVTVSKDMLENLDGLEFELFTHDVANLASANIVFTDGDQDTSNDVTDVTISQGGTSGSIKVEIQAIPEPTTATLSLLALCGLAARRRRK